MIWNLISSIIVTIFILILGSFVYFRDRESSTHKAFFAMSISIVGWIITLAISYLQGLSKEFYFLVVGLCQGFGNFIALFAFHFLYFFPQRKAKIPWWEVVFIFIPAAILTYFTVFSRLVFQEVEFGKGPFGLPVDISGPLYPVVVFWLSTTVISGIVAFYWKFRKALGKVKMQMKYVFLGTVLFAGFTLTTNQIIPVIARYIFKLQQLSGISILGYWGALIFASFVTYAVVKHRLMDIRLILIKSLTYSFLILLITSLYLLVIFYLKDPLALKLQISPNTTFVLTGLLLVLGFSPIKRLIEKLTDRWLYKKRYNPSLVLDRIGEITNSILLLDPLLKSLLQTLTSEMKISKMAILLENQSQALGYNFKKLSYLKFKKLLEKNNILVTDELEEESSVKESLRKLNISLLVPLLIEQKPIGLLVLGDKKSGDAYTKEDISFLVLLAHQIAIALKNAQLYSKIVADKERIKKILQTKEELEKTKERLISSTSSQIKTPLTKTEEYLSKAEKEKENLSPKAKAFLARALEASDRSVALLSKMIEAAQLENKEIQLQLKEVDLEELMTKVINQFLPQTKEKNLHLEYIKEKNLPFVLADPKYLEKVLDYLLENALKFTEKGKITISLGLRAKGSELKAMSKGPRAQGPGPRAQSQEIIVSVSDTGVGIPKEHLPHIFEKFYQADTSLTRQYQGTGLGLYVVKLLLKLHKSKIKVESKPKVGSKFSVWLPIYKEKRCL